MVDWDLVIIRLNFNFESQTSSIVGIILASCDHNGELVDFLKDLLVCKFSLESCFFQTACLPMAAGYLAGYLELPRTGSSGTEMSTGCSFQAVSWSATCPHFWISNPRVPNQQTGLLPCISSFLFLVLYIVT